MVEEHFEDELEDLGACLDIDQAAGLRGRRVVGRVSVHRNARERLDRQTVGTTPCHAPLRVDALEVPEHQAAEVDRRCQPRATALDRAVVELG